MNKKIVYIVRYNSLFMEIGGEVAIVTGGSSGIGKAISKRFKQEGLKVVIADISGEDVAKKLGCEFIETDVSDNEQVEDMVDQTVKKFGRLDVLVNNAGIGSQASIKEMDIEEYHKIRSVDLDGVVYGCRAASPHLIENKGCIINVASIYGLVGDVGATAYNAAKGGVVNLTRSVADDLAMDKVRANSICPGFVKTAMTEEGLKDEEFRNHVLEQTPMGRVAEPEEIAGAAAFLASEDASFITGVNLPVDGGWTSH